MSMQSEVGLDIAAQPEQGKCLASICIRHGANGADLS